MFARVNHLREHRQSPKGEVEGIGLAVALFLLKVPGFFSRCLLSLSARGLEG